MRKLLVGLLVLVGAGCGGGGGSSVSGPVTGTISGQAFTPTTVSAVIAGPTSCSEPTAFTAKALAVRFADYADGVCTDLTSDPICTIKASGRSVTVALADVAGTNPTPALAPGRYKVVTNPTDVSIGTGVLAGTFTVAFAISMSSGTLCDNTQISEATGKFTVDTITDTGVTGSVDLTFADGGSLKGTFDATMCTETVDICSLTQDAGTILGGGTCSTQTCD